MVRIARRDKATGGQSFEMIISETLNFKASADSVGFVARRLTTDKDVYWVSALSGGFWRHENRLCAAVFERLCRSSDTQAFETSRCQRVPRDQPKTRSQERPQALTQEPAAAGQSDRSRAAAARKLQAPPGEPWRATPRGQRARASSTPTARGLFRGARGACLPGGEAWGGTM